VEIAVPDEVVAGAAALVPTHFAMLSYCCSRIRRSP
jgi:hypothetical protein